MAIGRVCGLYGRRHQFFHGTWFATLQAACNTATREVLWWGARIGGQALVFPNFCSGSEVKGHVSHASI
eukprot:1558383-Lingulodinium_polyedra.AAC.1